MTKNSTNSNSSSTTGVAGANEERQNGAMNGGQATNGANGVNSGLRKGPWTAAEDAILVEHVRRYGEGNWNAVQRSSGLARCGKSCRLRWANHLRPNLKKGPFSPEEELLILRLHARIGNKWARIATHLDGRTDNEIKNYWNTRLKRRQRAGLAPYPLEVERELGLTRKFNQNITAFSDNRNTNYNGGNAQFLLQPSPLNFSNSQTNGIGANSLLNQSFQSYPNFTNQIQTELPMLTFANSGQNTSTFRSQMNYGLTNFNSNPSSMMPSYQPIKSEMPSSQMYLDQTQVGAGQVPRVSSNGTGAPVFDGQSGLGLQNLQRIPSLPSLPQLIPADPTNWGNGNTANIGGNSGGMNRQGELGSKWGSQDCTNGLNNSMLKSELKDSVIQKTMEELSILLNPDNSGGSGGETSGGHGGGSVITNDEHTLGIHQHFIPPLTPEGPTAWE
ncbi:Transcription factor GAMYB [Rhynchospora pubera]|uniref:Transcription factor GAMYB n=1 Tax=Rhynchospora pubera TaxID=906938 RepID=A0AAV8G5I6_9POAL|nr:Transcription factor GAMYB [Rhynchospora pubera]